MLQLYKIGVQGYKCINFQAYFRWNQRTPDLATLPLPYNFVQHPVKKGEGSTTNRGEDEKGRALRHLRR
jgi:hypothetical protein